MTGFFALFPEGKKSAKIGRESSANLVVALELMATGGLSGGGGRVLLLRLREHGVEAALDRVGVLLLVLR